MLDIEKDVPMPTARGPLALYPFRKMEIGDSFFVPNVESGGKQERSIRANAYMMARELNKKFSTRAIDGGIRVWRIA